MALIVEDGTGKANAEAYISVADAAAYFAARGSADAWDAIEDKEAALRKGADFMQQNYSGRWLGMRATSGQALDWPRAYVPDVDSPGGYGGSPAFFSSTSVPEAVKRANAELAMRSVSAELAPDQGPSAIEKTVGPITIKYDPLSSQETQYSAVDMLLKKFLSVQGSMAKLVRA